MIFNCKSKRMYNDNIQNKNKKNICFIYYINIYCMYFIQYSCIYTIINKTKVYIHVKRNWLTKWRVTNAIFFLWSVKLMTEKGFFFLTFSVYVVFIRFSFNLFYSSPKLLMTCKIFTHFVYFSTVEADRCYLHSRHSVFTWSGNGNT